MALTRDFRETVMARARRDPAFRRQMLKGGVELMLRGDPEDAADGREQLRDYINATIGFQELARLVDKGPKSLMHMFSTEGNPSSTNLGIVLAQLQAHEGVELGVTLRRRKR
jgi:hypothetical protein